MTCSCQEIAPNKLLASIRINQQVNPERVIWRNSEWLVVPVIMAVDGVEMNDSVIPTEEFHAPSWNGTPVTFGHPEKGGEPISANSPLVLDEYGVGYLFDAAFTGGKLRANAWVNVDMAETVRPGSIEELEAGDKDIDVSTGYFSDDIESPGITIHKDIKPDHLAILFDIPGACSFGDGCGVRTNNQGAAPMAVKASEKPTANKPAIKQNAGPEVQSLDLSNPKEFEKALTLEVNRRGHPDDYRQMVADLISNDASPFVPEDMYALMDMSSTTLKTLRDGYAQPVNTNSAQEEDGNMEENNPAEGPNTNSALSEEDRKALVFARNSYQKHRESLTAKIAANSNMTEDSLKEMPVETLEVIAEGLRSAEPDQTSPVANYSLRPNGNQSISVNQEKDKEVGASMQAPNIFASTETK